jgi:hypothetical protein
MSQTSARLAGTSSLAVVNAEDLGGSKLAGEVGNAAQRELESLHGSKPMDASGPKRRRR